MPPTRPSFDRYETAPAEACPECGGRLLRSDRLIPDLVILGCKACDRKRLDGDDEWFAGKGVVPLLVDRAEELAEAQRFREFFDADARTDPRWTLIQGH